MATSIVVKEVGQRAKACFTDDIFITPLGVKYIKDYPQKIQIHKGLYILLDESGLLKDLPVNFLVEMTSKYWPIQKMVGTVVFCRIKPVYGCREIYDYEIENLTSEDFSIIESILSDEYQKHCIENFEDYEKGSIVYEEITPEKFKELFL